MGKAGVRRLYISRCNITGAATGHASRRRRPCGAPGSSEANTPITYNKAWDATMQDQDIPVRRRFFAYRNFYSTFVVRIKATNMQKQNRWLILLLAVALVLGYFWCEHRETETAVPVSSNEPASSEKPGAPFQKQDVAPVDALTKETVVVPYLKKNGRLPDYYITKQEARKKGWIASEGNLCTVLPGRAIGGDLFTNRQKALPVKNGRTWYEADLNYACGRRNADRVLFSNDGLVFVTKDHYKTFEEK